MLFTFLGAFRGGEFGCRGGGVEVEKGPDGLFRAGC